MTKQKFNPIQQQEVIIQALDTAFPKIIFSLVSPLLIIILFSSCMFLLSDIVSIIIFKYKL